jgi:hypothetical protein
MTDKACQALQRTIEDLLERVARDDGSNSFGPPGLLFIPPQSYDRINRRLMAAIDRVNSGDIEAALTLLVAAARAIGHEAGYQSAQFEMSEKEVLRRASARYGSIGGSTKAISFERRRQQVVAQIMHKATWNPWRNPIELEQEILQSANTAFSDIKYGRRQIDLILRAPEIRVIYNQLKRQARRKP